MCIRDSANGGPLRGQQVWGQYPVLELDGTQAVGRGRMVPTLSVNQVGSTLAQWFGLPSSSVASIFTGIENFSQQKLGFLGSVSYTHLDVYKRQPLR